MIIVKVWSNVDNIKLLFIHKCVTLKSQRSSTEKNVESNIKISWASQTLENYSIMLLFMMLS